MPSKLALARIARGFTQAKVAEYVGVEVVTICRWEHGSTQPYPRHAKKLCDLYGKTAFDLGLTCEIQEVLSAAGAAEPKGADLSLFTKFFHEDLELRLQCVIYDWLHGRASDPRAALQHSINMELGDDTMTNEQHRQDQDGMDITRRKALQRIALTPIHALSLGTLGASATSWQPEDLLTHCAAGVVACEHLIKGQHEDMTLAYSVLSTYLPPLKAIVDESAPHRKEAARLVAQALNAKATLSVHKEGPKRAAGYGKQAAIYAKESGDSVLRLIVLKRLAWIYACDQQPGQALETVLQAQALLQKATKRGLPIHPTIHSSVLGGVAKYQARNGQDENALDTLHSTYDTFFAETEKTTDSYVEHTSYNFSFLLLEDGLTNYYLELHDQALSSLDKAVDLKTLAPRVPMASELTRIEIINHATLASLKSPTKDMEWSIALWEAGIQGAMELHSEQRFNEALEALSIMQALWPGEARIKELRDRTRQR